MNQGKVGEIGQKIYQRLEELAHKDEQKQTQNKAAETKHANKKSAKKATSSIKVQPQTAKEQKTAPDKEAYVHFVAIDMSGDVAAVNQLMGSEGTILSEAGDIQLYEWNCGGQGRVQCEVQKGKIISKTQFGMPIQQGSVQLAQFDAIENGMTEEAVEKALGHSGMLLMENHIGGAVTKNINWFGASQNQCINLTFQNGKVVAKSQVGLS